MVRLALDRLSMTRAGRRVVEDVSFTAAGGALIRIVGPNGTGKSSLVQAMLGLVPSQGGILLDGEPLGSRSRADIARTLAYLPQGQSLYWPLSVESSWRWGGCRIWRPCRGWRMRTARPSSAR